MTTFDLFFLKNCGVFFFPSKYGIVVVGKGRWEKKEVKALKWNPELSKDVP